jgi:hypothetical protein
MFKWLFNKLFWETEKEERWSEIFLVFKNRNTPKPACAFINGAFSKDKIGLGITFKRRRRGSRAVLHIRILWLYIEYWSKFRKPKKETEKQKKFNEAYALELQKIVKKENPENTIEAKTDVCNRAIEGAKRRLKLSVVK